MSMKNLFKQHIELRTQQLSKLIEANGYQQLVIESGFPDYYYLDDQPTFFKTNPHFNFLCPGEGEGHVLTLQSGQKPKLYFYIPNDIWHETSSLKGDFWEEFFDIEVISDPSIYWKQANAKGALLVSPQKRDGFSTPTPLLLEQMHWLRTSKTDYEIACIRLANQKAAKGHLAAREAFLSGKTERQTLSAYLEASQQTQAEQPYNSIVGFDDKAAVLHYQNTRFESGKNSFLIDAGARFNGYCSDISRTHLSDNAHPTFKDIHAKLDSLQKSLCLMVQPGVPYVELHAKAHQGISDILCESGIYTGCQDEAKSAKLADFFYPHGLGHPLGLQVHDVAGKVSGPEGKYSEKNPDYPFLRTLRNIQNNDVLTIEPGLYFIPQLLNELKGSDQKDKLNWNLIEELLDHGGIRIEDNVVAKESTPLNLTREFLPN